MGDLSCKYNVGVCCADKANCDRCGWNPRIEVSRKQETMQKAVHRMGLVPDSCKRCVALEICYQKMCCDSHCKIRDIMTIKYLYDIIARHVESLKLNSV